MRRMLLCFGLIGLLLPTSAAAVEVFLNGVKITGLSDQTIEGAKVVLDKSGNVHIDAPEYKVSEVGGGSTVKPTPAPTPTPAPAANPAGLSNHYFVITEVTKPGVTGYKIQLIINNKFIKDLPDTIPQNVVELNPHLLKGDNTVSFRALRPAGVAAKSKMATDAFTVLIGKGKSGPGGQLTIEEVVAEFKVLAIDSGEKAKSFPVKAK